MCILPPEEKAKEMMNEGIISKATYDSIVYLIKNHGMVSDETYKGIVVDNNFEDTSTYEFKIEDMIKVSKKLGELIV